MTNSRAFKGALAASVIAVLAACGGGGGDAPPNNTVKNDVTVEGVVAKGPAKGATVRIYPTDATGKKGALLKTVTTGEGGVYSALIPAQTYPVLIEADLNNAAIEDELVPGTTYLGKSGEKMLAVLALQSGAKTVANVTPFSDMAAAMASSHGGVDTYKPADVVAANQKIRSLTITDHLTASPTGEFKVKLTAVAQFVKDNHPEDLGAALTALREGGKFDDAKNGFIVTALVAQQLSTACAATTATTCATDNNFGSPIAAATPVIPVPVADVTALGAAQALFKDLRDTAGAYSNSGNTGELDKAGDKLSLAVSSATGFVDDEMLAIIAGLRDGKQQYDNAKANPSITPVYGRDYDRSVFGQVQTKTTTGQSVLPTLLPMYSCNLFKVTTTTTVSGALDISALVFAGSAGLPASDINAFACSGVGTYGNLVGTALDDGLARNHFIIVVPQSDGSFKYVHQTRKNNFDRTLQAASVRDGDLKFGTATFVKDANGRTTAVSVVGELSPGFKMLRARTVAERDKFKHHAVNLAITASYPAGSTTNDVETLTVGGSIKLLKVDGSEASSLTIADGSVLSAKTGIERTSTRSYSYVGGSYCPTGPGYSQTGVVPSLTCIQTWTYTSTDSELSALNLSFTAAVPDAKFEGTVKAGDASFDKSNTSYRPTSGSFEGKIYEGDGAGGYRLLLAGKVTAAATDYQLFDERVVQSALNFYKTSVGFEGKVMLKDRPEAGLTLNVQNTAFDKYAMSGTFFWNAKSFNISGSKDDTPGATNPGELKFTNSDAVAFTLPRNGRYLPQDITKGGYKVGTINLDRKRIDYIDGSFEQF